MARIELRSSAFDHLGYIPQRYGRHGCNISPPLAWSGIPRGTTELLLLCEDPDGAPAPFLHWLVTGIDPTTGGVAEGETPKGGRSWSTDFGEPGWAGPAPPPSDEAHRFVFRVYALADAPQLPANPTAYAVHEAVDTCALASGVLIGAYQQ